MELRFETLDRWPYGGSGNGSKNSPFRATYPRTLQLLDAELRRASARSVTLQTGHRGEDIRLDGAPRVNARVPRFSGVSLSFEMWTPNGKVNEKQQPLGTYELFEFPCARFTYWEDNLRAIALTLQAIRETQKVRRRKT